MYFFFNFELYNVTFYTHLESVVFGFISQNSELKTTSNANCFFCSYAFKKKI